MDSVFRPDEEEKGDAFDDEALEEQEQQPEEHPASKPSSTATDLQYVDHFSLRGPSGKVRFRGADIKVYEQTTEQFLLEERLVSGNDDDDAHHQATRTMRVITVKRMRSGTFGLRFLRVGYTLVALLMLCFLFVFCFQMVLFLFLDLPAQSGATKGAILRTADFLGGLLAIPLLLHSMASIMAMGTAFVSDTWNGHALFRSIMDWPIVFAEWITFMVFVGIPVLAGIILLFLKRNNWWETTALVWMWSVLTFFIVFSVGVIWLEVTACFDLVDLGNQAQGVTPEVRGSKLLGTMKQAFLMSQTQRLSGTREEKYLVGGDDEYPENGYCRSPDFVPVRARTSLSGHLTSLKCLRFMFDLLEPPVRRYNMDEVRGILQFVTNENWSLERMFCRNRNIPMTYAVKGPSSLTRNQIKSTFVCTALGLLLVLLLVMACLIWFSQPAVVVVIVVLLFVLCCAYPMMRTSWNLYQMYSSIHPEEEEEEENERKKEVDEGSLFQIWETVNITRPKEFVCWVELTFSFAFLYLYPLVILYRAPNPPVALLFLILGVVSSIRIYFDASRVLAEYGSIDQTALRNQPGERSLRSVWRKLGIRGTLAKSDEKRDLFLKSRTSEVMGKITRSHTTKRWIVVYGILALVLVAMTVLSLSAESFEPEEGRDPILQLDGFYYPPLENLAYPTCQLAKGFDLEGLQETPSLADYAFLSAMSYETPEVTQYLLDKRYGTNEAIEETEFVRHYREEYGVESQVFFKLFSFPRFPGLGVISIRGSQTGWDFLVDAQIWSAAALAQVVEAFIPFGWIWNVILDDLVLGVNWIESESLKKVSYYRTTTQFINDVLVNNYTDNGRIIFDQLRLTGHSLGGGTAIISGAQTLKANAIGISAPNAHLSRMTFDPPVSAEDLNDKVFNVIPDRDLVAWVGERSRQFQEVECRAPAASLFGCHSLWRTVCELTYTCGSEGKPVFCQCVYDFGYPEPLPKNGTMISFDEACLEEERKFVELLG